MNMHLFCYINSRDASLLLENEMGNLQFIDLKEINELVESVSSLVNEARSKLAESLSAGLVLTYWKVGQLVYTAILKEARADYGESIVFEISKKLKLQYGEGFSKSNLFKMIQFYKYFLNENEVLRIAGHLSWSHFVALIALEDPLQRKFYVEMCRIEKWSVRLLRRKIQGMLYERVGLSKKPEETIEKDLKALQNEDVLSTDLVFQDPYLLDFLSLRDTYSEKDLENAIIYELEKFLLEFGTDFCFMARQKRISIGDKDYYIDLLFFHRRLNRLIAVEIKLGGFVASHKGQMELYLRWLDKNERQPQEEKPLGIILCSKKEHDLVELLELSQTGIHVAEYLTQLPPQAMLEDRLHKAILKAKERIARHQPLLEEYKKDDE